MKKIITSIILICIAFNACVSLNVGAIMPPYVESVEIIGNETITMYVGDEITLEATATPGGVDFAYMLWTTDSESIITIAGDNGTTKFEPPISTANIKAICIGTVVVTVYSDAFSEPYPDEYTANDSVTIKVLPRKTTSTERMNSFVYDLNGEVTNVVEVSVSDLIWKDENEHTLMLEDNEKRPIDIDSVILENAKEYEHIIIMDIKTDNSENPYPEIESMNVSVEHPNISGGLHLLGKDYRLFYFSDDSVEDLSENITASDTMSVDFTADKLGKYVIYLNPKAYDLTFYMGEPISTEDTDIMPEIYYEIRGMGSNDIVEFPEMPKKEGYVFAGWKAWSGSGIYYIESQPITGHQYPDYYATWCPEDEYEPINIAISTDKTITKGNESGTKITLATNYGVFVEDDDFPSLWRSEYEAEANEQTKSEILSDWKSTWNVVGSDEIMVESASRIDDKTVELTLSGNSSDKYSKGEIYIEFDSSLLMAEPYEVNGEIVYWDDEKIKMDEDGVREKMYRSDNSLKLVAQSKSSSGGSSVTPRYTVSFETNSGSSIKKLTVNKNSAVKEPEQPKKDGYVFVGWYADKELTTKFDFTSKITKNITLYAKWDLQDDSVNKMMFTIGETKAKIFGKEKENDVAPIIKGDRAFLPARFVAESLGAVVEWNAEKRAVTITKDDTTIIITIGEETAIVNGEKIKLDYPAFIENDRTYTPIRFVAENLGCGVEWDDTDRVISIMQYNKYKY